MPKKQVATVEEVRACLEEWRQSRRHKRTAIPDELWSAAIEVARRDGLGRTAAALRLDYGKLKRLMMAADGAEMKSASPAFMELIARPRPQQLRNARSKWRAGARGYGSSLKPARPMWSASAGLWRS